MTEYIAALAPDDLPDIEYTRVNEEQARHIREAMELPNNQANFDVSFLSLDTPEQRRAVAEEWAGFRQAMGNMRARDEGAVLIFSSKDESPEALLKLIEDEEDNKGRKFVTHAVLKVVKKNRDANTIDLLRKYYRLDED